MSKVLIGNTYGHLKVLYKANYKKSNSTYWHCLCTCGNEKDIAGKHLLSGATTSCGCKQYATPNIKHGKYKTRLYNIYRHIKSRCNNKNDDNYKNYGGRGIKVCNEWLNDFMSFYNWALQNGYKDNLTIDRINVNGNYEPNNCRWATIEQQANNTTQNIYISHNGIILTLSQWAKKLGLNTDTFYYRYKKYGNVDKIYQVGRIKHE